MINTLNAILILICVLVFYCYIYLYQKKQNLSIFHPIIIINSLIFLFFYFKHISNYFYKPIHYDKYHHIDLYSLFVVFLFSFFFTLGCILVINKKLYYGFKIKFNAEVSIDKLAYIFVPIILVFSFIVVSSGYYWGNVEQQNINRNVSIVLYLNKFLIFFYILLILPNFRKLRKFEKYVHIITILICIIYFYMLGEKKNIVLIFGCLIIFYYYFIQKISLEQSILIFSIFFIFFIFILIPFFSIYRWYIFYEYPLNSDGLKLLINQFTEIYPSFSDFIFKSFGRFNGIDSLSVLIIETQNNDILKFGSTFMKFFYSLVPSFILESKFDLINGGEIFNRKTYGSFYFSDWSMFWFSEFYLNFNILGVIILSFILGLFLTLVFNNIENMHKLILPLFIFFYIKNIVNIENEISIVLATYLKDCIFIVLFLLMFNIISIQQNFNKTI
tara:strand:- start:1814 stop:3145 length:1332 start_codon:yes stop_codon:yes gene_type:complete